MRTGKYVRLKLKKSRYLAEKLALGGVYEIRILQH